MALNIKNEHVHALAREASQRAGVSQTSVIETALERYLADLKADDSSDERQQRTRRAKQLIHEIQASLTDDDRRDIRRAMDELYDVDGLPR